MRPNTSYEFLFLVGRRGGLSRTGLTKIKFPPYALGRQEGMENSIKAWGISDRLSALSDRQREIVVLVCRGLSNRLIADELVVSEGTIKTHLHAIFGMLGVQSRFELMAMLSNRER